MFRTAFLLAALAAGPALAQSADYRSAEDIRVVTPDGKKMGEVEEVLIDATGRPSALAVDFDRWLDLDPDERAVPVEAFTYDGKRYTLDMTPEALAALPAWRD